MRHLGRIFSCVLIAFLLAAGAEAGENRWTPIGVGTGVVKGLAADPETHEVVYAAVGMAGIYRSTDAARTWEWRGKATVTLEDWNEVVIAPGDPQRLYATTRPTQVSSGGLYTSGDAGRHWQELLRDRVGFDAVAVSPNGALLAAQPIPIYTVFHSADGGRTWTVVLQPEHSGGDLPLALAFDPLAPEVAYAGAGTGLWRSTDSGATWTQISTLPINALAFPGTAPGVLYALSGNRILFSENAGLSWSGGALAPGASSDLAVDPADPQTVYVSGGKIFVSHDRATTTQEITPPAPGNSQFHIQLAISPAAPSILYAGLYGQGVAVSTDRGEHWTIHDQQGLSGDYFFRRVFHPASSGRLYHMPLDNGVIFRSLDRGAHWSPLAPVSAFSAPALSEEPGYPDSLWAATGEALFHSTDGGESWSRSSLSEGTLSVASPARGVVLAGGCGIWRSTDGGRTWTEVFPCVIGDGGLLVFRRVERIGVPHGWPGAAWAEVVKLNTSGTSERLIVFTQSSGRTWRTLARGIGSDRLSHRVAASRGVIYLVRGRTLQRSRDGGASWESLAPGANNISSVAVDTADPDVVYVATANLGVLRSTDGGATWRQLNAGLARLGRLRVVDVMTDPALPGVAYALPFKGGIFQGRFAPSTKAALSTPD